MRAVLGPSIVLFFALAVAAAAAVSDLRAGEIPNWLTLPPIVLAPLAYGLALGFTHALHCLGAALLSGLVPYVLFRRNAMGGGDVKLFVALGAITGFDLLAGLEIQLAAVCMAMIYALGKLAWRGVLLRTLGAAFAAPFNAILPGRRHMEVGETLRTPIRMGGFVLLATGFVAFPTLALSWSVP